MLLQLLIALPAVAAASDTKVIINLSEQRAYLVEQGRVTLTSPVASGKPGWPTPTGNSRIFNKDIDHRSRSFGSVVDCYGRVVNSNATPASHVPAGGHYRPAPMPYFMEFSPAVGMHAGYLPGYPASTGACGCLENSLRCFLSGSIPARQSRSSAAHATWFACERLFRYQERSPRSPDVS